MPGPSSLTNPTASQAVIKFSATVNPNSSTGPLVNPVDVTSATLDGNPGNNHATATIQVVGTPRPDVTVAKEVSGAAVAGADLTYLITVSNAGDAPASGVKLTDVLPANTSFVSFNAPAGWTVTAPQAGATSGTITADKTTDLANEAAVFTFVVHVGADVTGTINNQATVSTTTTESGPPSNNTSSVAATVIRQAGLTITKTDNQDTARPGDPITYVITVANPPTGSGGGPSNVTGITVRDLFDTASLSNITYTSTASGGATGNTATGAGDINDTNVSLPVASSITYTVNATILSSATGTLSNTATIVTPAGTTNTGTASAPDTTALNPLADLGVTKTTTDAVIVAGNNITYTITVTNFGVSDATGVQLLDTVPTGTTFESFTQNTGVTWSQDSQPTVGGTGTIQYSIPSLAPNASATFTLVVKTNPGTDGTNVENQAFVTTQTTQPTPDTTHPDTAIATTSVVATLSPDLIVSKTDTPDPVIAGPTGAGTTTGFLTYTIRVTNQGAVAANQVQLTDIMPTVSNGVAPIFVSFTAPAGWTVNSTPAVGASTGQIRVTSNNNATSDLDPQEFADFTLVVRVPPAATNGATITNTATVATAIGSTTPESVANQANNSATATTTIATSANLAVTKTGPSQPVVVGSTISYVITVSSVGPSNASSVVLTDLIPVGTTFVSLVQNTGTTGWTINAPSGGAVTATNSTLAPGATGSFTLTVRTNNNLADGAVVSNFATVTSATPDAVPGNNTSPTVNTTVLVPIDMGDAPDSYGTLLASNGARHSQSSASGLYLGSLVDTEINGQPNPAGLGDDENGIDDEDGIVLSTTLLAGRGAAIIANSSGTGKLDAWIDFNGDGDFLDAGEQIAASYPVFAGPNGLAFTVPADATLGGTFARFRLSTAGGLAPTGSATDGEVEDYGVTIATVTPGTTLITPDPENPGFNMLSINGTAKNDTISVAQLRNHLLQVQVTFNGVKSKVLNMDSFRRIVVYAGAGSDTVNIGLSRPSSLHGEAGNDRLNGGGGWDEIFGEDGNDTLNGNGGNDVLVGGTGKDTVSGGADRDLLIGGFGVDTLSGGAGDDVLIGGTTSHDTNRAALAVIMATLGATNNGSTPASRVSALSPLLNSSTVQNDGSKDRLDGGAGSDWYVDYLLADTLVGFSSKTDKKN